MEGDIHTFLDFATLVATLWVVYMIRYKLKSTYVEELDNMKRRYLVNTFLLLKVSSAYFIVTLYLSAVWLVVTKCGMPMQLPCI